MPEDQSDSFNSLVRYLGLSNEISAPSKITPSEKFNMCSPGVTLQEEGQVAVHYGKKGMDTFLEKICTAKGL